MQIINDVIYEIEYTVVHEMVISHHTCNMEIYKLSTLFTVPSIYRSTCTLINPLFLLESVSLLHFHGMIYCTYVVCCVIVCDLLN